MGSNGADGEVSEVFGPPQKRPRPVVVHVNHNDDVDDDCVSVHSADSVHSVSSDDPVAEDWDERCWKHTARRRCRRTRLVLCASLCFAQLTPLYTADNLYDWFANGCPLIMIRILAAMLPSLKAKSCCALFCL